MYPAQSGGPSNTVYWMAKALHQNGLPVATITTSRDIDGKVPYDQELLLDYGKVIYLDVPNYKYSWRILKEVIKGLKESDIFQPASFFYPIAFPGVVAAIWMGKKVVWSIRGEFFGPAIGKSLFKRTLIGIVKLFFKKRIYFHATSQEEASSIKKWMGEDANIILIPNLIEIPPSTAIEKEKKSYSYFLFVGRINKIKALDNLLEALAKNEGFLKSKMTLKIAGNHNTSFGREIKSMVKKLGLEEKIEFLGLVTGKEKENLFQNAFFTLLPSHSENFGNIVLESLAYGTPVIASTGTPWEVLEEERAGYWRDNDLESLNKVIEEALNLKEDTYSGFRKAAWQFVREKFEINRNIHLWIEQYNSLVKA